jgi:hypothetical protein
MLSVTTPVNVCGAAAAMLEINTSKVKRRTNASAILRNVMMTTSFREN